MCSLNLELEITKLNYRTKNSEEYANYIFNTLYFILTSK